MASLQHEMTVHVKLDEKSVAEAKQAPAAIEDEALRVHIRRVLAEEEEALFTRLSMRLLRALRSDLALPDWARMETKAPVQTGGVINPGGGLAIIGEAVPEVVIIPDGASIAPREERT